jgi:hypothetical protein
MTWLGSPGSWAVAAGMTLFLLDGVENLFWNNVPTLGRGSVSKPDSYLWGEVSLLAVEDLGTGLLRGFHPFRHRVKAGRKTP